MNLSNHLLIAYRPPGHLPSPVRTATKPPFGSAESRGG
jgi:hypothetical protein